MVMNSLKSLKLCFIWLLAIAGMLTLASCGSGGGGTEAAVEKTTVVVGKFEAPKSTVSAVSIAAPQAAGDPMTVHVLSEPSITTTVAADGTFTLRGLPTGSFTLVFMQGSTEIGRLDFGQVAPNQQITITVQLVGTEVVLVGQSRTGIGDAGVELEGPIQNVITLNAAGDSRIVVSGRSVVVRPGVTAIRKGNTAMTVNDLTVGTQVHVKGTTVAGSTDVLAFEIIIQNTSGTDDTQITICHIPPGNPTHPVTITISSSAWPAHEAHGDHEGACTP
jgi:hypothetical protein